MSARNLPHVEVLPTNVRTTHYSILNDPMVADIRASGLEQLIARLDAPIKR